MDVPQVKGVITGNSSPHPGRFAIGSGQGFRLRNWIWIGLASLLGLIALGALAIRPWAKSTAHSQAEARGLSIQFRQLSVGFMEADFKDLRVQPEGVRGVAAHLKDVHVELSFSSPRVRTVIIEGGSVEVNGSLSEVEDDLKAWKARRPQVAEEPASHGSARVLIGRDLEAIWKDALGRGTEQSVKGLNFERTGESTRLGADLIRLELGELVAEIAGSQITLGPGSLNLKSASRVGASEMRLTYRSVSPEQNGSLKDPMGSANVVAPVDALADEEKEESTDNGLGQRLRRNPERVQRVLAALDLLRTEVLPRLPPGAEVEKLWFTFERERQSLHVGPSTVQAARDSKNFRLSITPRGAAKGTPLSASLILPLTQAESRLEIEGGPVSLSTLGIEEGAFGLHGVSETTVEGAVTTTLSADAKVVRLSGQAGIHGLTLKSERLSEKEVSFPQIFVQGKAEMDVDGGRYTLSESEFSLGDARFVGGFDLKRDGDSVLFQAQAKAPLVSCQALLDSAPRGLLGSVESMTFTGTFSLDARVSADSERLSKMDVHFNFDNACRATAVPKELDPEIFRGSFSREVVGAGNFPMMMDFGPHSGSWVPYDEIAPLMTKALFVSEDGRFLRHDGIDDRAIESAIRDNTRAGKFLRGASTISMQLAKNLYLSRTKTLSRKFQEAALTSLLEQSFTKQELLELYLNVVEFGPGIYGVRRAAEHYFATVPEHLSAAQCFFLASILPMPSREHFAADGSLLPARKRNVDQLLTIAQKRSFLTEEELAAALLEQVVFGRADSRPPKAEEGSPSENSKPSEESAPGSALDNRAKQNASQVGTSP